MREGDDGNATVRGDEGRLQFPLPGSVRRLVIRWLRRIKWFRVLERIGPRRLLLYRRQLLLAGSGLRIAQLLNLSEHVRFFVRSFLRQRQRLRRRSDMREPSVHRQLVVRIEPDRLSGRFLRIGRRGILPGDQSELSEPGRSALHQVRCAPRLPKRQRLSGDGNVRERQMQSAVQGQQRMRLEPVRQRRLQLFG